MSKHTKSISKHKNVFTISDFSNRVYNVVKYIPRGKVTTYKSVARAIAHPRAVRAVGNALNQNRNPKIPCHRVIRLDGKIGGFVRGTKEKTRLLRNESVTIINNNVAAKHIIFKF
ncbi:MAG: MGMT family protein [Candidatus Sungbacteria bacterium]|nr:MGMT family protein [Candidatus Sungbacteria bacterium]